MNRGSGLRTPRCARESGIGLPLFVGTVRRSMREIVREIHLSLHRMARGKILKPVVIAPLFPLRFSGWSLAGHVLNDGAVLGDIHGRVLAGLGECDSVNHASALRLPVDISDFSRRRFFLQGIFYGLRQIVDGRAAKRSTGQNIVVIFRAAHACAHLRTAEQQSHRCDCRYKLRFHRGRFRFQE